MFYTYVNLYQRLIGSIAACLSIVHNPVKQPHHNHQRTCALRCAVSGISTCNARVLALTLYEPMDSRESPEFFPKKTLQTKLAYYGLLKKKPNIHLSKKKEIKPNLMAC